MPTKPGLLSKSRFAALVGVPRATVGVACTPGKALARAFSGSGREGRIDPTHPDAIAWRQAREGSAPHVEADRRTGRRGRPSVGETRDADAAAWNARAAELSGQRAKAEVDAALAAQRKPRKNKKPPQRKERKPSSLVERASVSVIEARAHDLPEHIRAVLDWTLADVVDKFGNLPQFEAALKAAKIVADIDEKRTKTAARRGELIGRELVRQHVMGAIDDALHRLLQDTPRTVVARARELIETEATDEDVETVVRELMSKQVRSMKQRARKGLTKSKAQEIVSEGRADA